MTPVTRWLRNAGLDTQPWLLVGKGPSFDRRKELMAGTAAWPVLGLNHVCRHLFVNIAHFTDMSAYRDCAAALEEARSMVCLPWHPHVGNRPSQRSLADFCAEDPTLAALRDAGRLLSYNSSLSRKRSPVLPTVTVRFFSAVAGLGVLAAAGVKVVRTLGVDGGTGYSKAFDPKDRLANGRPSFDVQFSEMNRIARACKIDLRPLADDPPHGG